MLYIFDLDDTLIEGYIKPKQPYTRVEPLPGRVALLEKLQERGHAIAIATNQGGVAFGYNTEDQAHSKIYDALFKLGLSLNTHYAVCFSDPRSHDERYNKPEDCARRKPSGAMIKEIMALYPDVDRSSVVYIGDMQTDEQAAADAGVEFVYADAFFVAERAAATGDGSENGEG